MNKTFLFVLCFGLAIGGFFAGEIAYSEMASSYKLQIAVEPSEASVWVDGKYLGPATKAAVTYDAPGEHLVRVVADGYLPESRRVSVSKGKSDFDFKLLRITRGSLAVESNPSGAVVIVDGHVRGRTPLKVEGLLSGTHVLEVAQTNYFSEKRSFDLAEESQTFNLSLRHRQIEALKARIGRDQEEVGVYNDIGELLFLLGKYDEAAQYFVKGFIVADKFGSRDEPNRRNSGKIKNEARNKHKDRDGKFHSALDLALIAAIEKGCEGRIFMDELKKVNIDKHGNKLESALKSVLDKQPNKFDLHVCLMDIYGKQRNYPELGRAVERMLAAGPKDARSCLDMIQIVREVFSKANRADRKAIGAQFEKCLAYSEKVFKSKRTLADLSYERSRLAELNGDASAERGFLLRAIELTSDKRKQNAWRLDVLNLMRKAGELEDAKKVAEEIIRSNMRNDPSVTRAKRKLREIERAIEKQRVKEAAARKRVEEQQKKREAKERERKEAEKSDDGADNRASAGEKNVGDD